jgi:ribonucleotide reductase, class II
MHGSDADPIPASNGLNGVAPVAQLGFGFAERRVSVIGGVEVDEIALPTSIVKRDGRVVFFDPMRIERALARCFAALGHEPYTPIPELALRVVNIMSARAGQPTVEIVQDAVELTLQAAGEFEAAKAYILYRAEHAKQRQERPVPDEVRQAFAQADSYFPTPIQKFQFFDKYSRFDYDKGRRETWLETVDRSVGFLHELVQDNTGVDLGSELYERLRRSILEMKSMPSMRLLAMAGAPARRDSTAIYNCSAQPVESIDSFCEALLISMAGCGVGYSVESRYVDNFPRIQRQRGFDSLRHVAGDSAQGWAVALKVGMEAWFEGRDVEFDFSEIREAGAPLRTKGGRASGPGPLRTMLEFTRARVLARQGSFLRPIDAHDIMCMVGNAAVSGGVRRTAMLSLFDYDDLEMRLCKNGDFERENSQRWNANNSAVWPERGLDQIQVVEQVLDMVKSQRGEPGIFNRQATIALQPDRRRQSGYTEYLTNPCVTADTWVLTSNGPRQVRELVGQQHETFSNGTSFSTTHDGFWRTGTRPVLRVRTREGYALRLTSNHQLMAVTHQDRHEQDAEWRRVDDLRVGDRLLLNRHRGISWSGKGTEADGWLLGSLVGDGTFSSRSGRADQLLTMAHLEYWGTNRQLVAAGARQMLGAAVTTRADCVGQSAARYDKFRLSSAGLAHLAAQYEIAPGHKAVTPAVEVTSSEFHRGFLRGLFDADGSVQGTQTNGVSVRLSQSNLATLEAVQRMLLRLGMASVIYRDRRSAGYRQLPDGHGGTAAYWTQAQHELVLAEDNLQEFARVIGFSDPAKSEKLLGLIDGYRRTPNRERFTATVESIEPDGVEDVFDCSVPGPNAFDANGFVSHNCGEIVLRKWELCNLSIAVARSEDTLASLKEKVEVATIIGTIQSLATNFPDLRPIWKQNCIEERLLGVDITGQMDSPAVHDPAVMRTLRELATETNRKLAAQLGINQSAAITTVKPSGNSSQLLNCSSGLHARWAPYYERNVRVAATSPIFKVLRDAGVPMDPENGQTRDEANTWVIHFPMKSPDGAITRKDRGAIEQCNYWLHNKLNWTDHNPSITVTYKPDEVLDLTKWIWEHRDLIGGMAFLPSFDAQYAQLPYIEISKEEFERRSADFPAIDFSKIWRYENTDLTNAAQELACLAGVCEVDG